jgi:hypothetical protein
MPIVSERGIICRNALREGHPFPLHDMFGVKSDWWQEDNGPVHRLAAELHVFPPFPQNL